MQWWTAASQRQCWHSKNSSGSTVLNQTVGSWERRVKELGCCTQHYSVLHLYSLTKLGCKSYLFRPLLRKLVRKVTTNASSTAGYQYNIPTQVSVFVGKQQAHACFKYAVQHLDWEKHSTTKNLEIHCILLLLWIIWQKRRATKFRRPCGWRIYCHCHYTVQPLLIL